jgi:DNA segregation ATPase FtsK/SpoIIIE, S-DNA-T family
VPSRRSRINQAVALHRQAAATTAAAAAALDAYVPQSDAEADQRELAERLRELTPRLAPGWLGASLARSVMPEGGRHRPAFVRIGSAQPLDDVTYPVVVPLVGTGHLAFDADARDPRVAGALRALLLRVLAAAPPGSLQVRAVDPAGALQPFSPLAESGLMPPPVTDHAGLRAVLAEAEHIVRPRRAFLIVITSFPELTEPADLARVTALAQVGPRAGVHMVVAGWPPPPLTAETAQAPLPSSTQVTLYNPHAVVTDESGATLAERVFLAPDPPPNLIAEVCGQVAARAEVQDKVDLTDVLPDPAEGLWTGDAADELAVTVGLAGDAPLLLRFNEMTPHWMVGGRSGSGKTAFLTTVLYGLSIRYAPAQLAIHLVGLGEGASFADFMPSERDPSWLPHVRTVGVEADREYGVSVLRELHAEMNRRMKDGTKLPRVLCVLEEFQLLLATEQLESLARKGRSYGIHLILSSGSIHGVEGLHTQIPVRVALPGGDDVLDASNDSAAGLPLGTAVVNTAGGLGGPRGATRGHEKVIRFPDPHADQPTLTALRRHLWKQRPADGKPPTIFEGYAHYRLADDPAYQELKPGAERRAMLLGRVVDARLSTAAYFGRHLAVLGPSEAGADLVDAAARSLAAQHLPGTASFVVASLVPEGHPVARRLVADLRAAGHSAQLVDTLEVDRPQYLVVFGMDGVVPQGCAHLIAWWRNLDRFDEQDIGGVVYLDVPVPELDWQPRPNRALFHDRDSGRSTVIVPFVEGAVR